MALERRKVFEKGADSQNKKRQKAKHGGLGDFKSKSNHIPQFQARGKGHCHVNDSSATPESYKTRCWQTSDLSASTSRKGCCGAPSAKRMADAEQAGRGRSLYIPRRNTRSLLSRERTVRRGFRAGRGDPHRRTVGRRVFLISFMFILAASIDELWEVQKRWQVDEEGSENKKGRDRIRREWRHTHFIPPASS